MGMEIVKKIGDTCIFLLKKYLLTGPKNNRPMQAGPYTEDFEKILFDTTIPHTIIFKCISWSESKFGLKSLKDHCVLRTGKPLTRL